MFINDELTVEIEQVLQTKPVEVCRPLPLGVRLPALNVSTESATVRPLLPLEGVDKETRAAELLTLIDCRMWWEGETLILGYWPCFEGPELRVALSMIDGPITIRPLTEPEPPSTRYVCPLPRKMPDESPGNWIKRRRAVLASQVLAHDDTDS